MFMIRLFMGFGLTFLFACAPTPPACTSGQPVAIFGIEDELIDGQSFEVEGQESLETVRFEGGQVLLELRQSGCEAVTQDYTFTLPHSHPAVGGGAGTTAATLFYFLGGIGPRLAQYQAFGDAVNAKAAELTDGREVELVPGMLIKVNQLTANGEVIQRVVLRQVPME